jgi:class 3 adenylate cyclase
MAAAPASSPAATPEVRPPFRLPLGLALTALVLLAVLSTALIVHLSWARTANRNIETIVGSLNARTADTVSRELETTFKSAEGVVEIVRSIFFQGAIKTEDEAKREYVFLSVLRSQPAISWVGFGFPDGRFFGSHALDNGKIEMVEIGDRIDETARTLRRDRYQPLPGDIFFEERSKGTSAYVPQGAKWFRSAKTANGPVWSMVDILPSGFEPAAVVSTKLELYQRFEGIIMVSLNLGRLSQFLSRLDIANEGAARIISERGIVVASSNLPAASPLDSAFAQLSRSAQNGMVDVPGYGSHYVTVTPLGFNNWRLQTVIPRSAFTAEIDRNTRLLIFVIIGLALLAAGTAALFANLFFARPIRRIAGELRHIESFSLNDVRHVPTRLMELDNLSSALKRMASSLSAFGLYVPSEIVRALIAQGIEPKPGGELREITVMFADLPGFTRMTERFGADVEPFLTKFLTLATEAIHREGGTVDKFIGDCIMGIWNAPPSVEDHAVRACRAAIVIRDIMQTIARPDGDKSNIRVRIGINTGIALVGNIGSSQRLSYTAIGDTVNVASRLEALAKDYEAQIMISDATRAALGARADLKPLGEAMIRGRENSLRVFELLALRESAAGTVIPLRHDRAVAS